MVCLDYVGTLCSVNFLEVLFLGNILYFISTTSLGEKLQKNATARKPTLHLQGSQVKKSTHVGRLNELQPTDNGWHMLCGECTQHPWEDPHHRKEITSKGSEVHLYTLALSWELGLPSQSAAGRGSSRAQSAGMCWRRKGVGRDGQKARAEGKTSASMWGRNLSWHNNDTLSIYKNFVQSET